MTTYRERLLNGHYAPKAKPKANTEAKADDKTTAKADKPAAKAN